MPPFTPVKQGSPPNANAWAPLAPGAPLFVTQPYKIISYNPAMVGGSYLSLQFYRQDRSKTLDPSTNSSNYLLKLQLKGQPVDRVWIAYDTRATSVPTWMSAKFVRTQPFRLIKTTLQDQTNNDLIFGLYELPKGLGYYQGDLLLGGNNAAGVSWNGVQVGEQYLVLVRMEYTIDKTQKTAVGNPVDVVMCSCESESSNLTQSAIDAARDKALSDWVEKNPKYKDANDKGLLTLELTDPCSPQQDNSPCGAQQSLRTSGDGTDRYVNSWERFSSGTIDANQSSLSVEVLNASNGTVKGSGSTSLHGTIDFRLGTDSNAEIGGLALYGTNVALSDGTTINSLSIGQEATIIAECDDSLPPGPFRLCGDYMVPGGAEPGFKASSYAEVNSNGLEVVLENSQPMPLTVDFNSMTFAMSGGPLEGSITINDEPLTVRVSVDMAGPFTSLAPVASIAETPTYWECSGRYTSSAEVTLDASSSGDELGGSILVYKWVEDRGALSERTLAISVYPTHTETLSLGVHHLSLLVLDDDLIWNSLDLDLEVGDSRIDVLDIPPDVWAQLPIGAPGAYVNIGAPGVDDYCSGAVDVATTASPTGWYPQGYSTVEYCFDDFHGNVVHHVQKVFVTEMAYYPPPVSDVSVAVAELHQGQVQQITHIIQTQGKAILADEYILLRGPGPLVASVNEAGEIIPGGADPHARDAVFGASNGSVVVFNDVFSDYLSTAGRYLVEASLVIPGGSPDSPESILARSWTEFEYSP